MTWVAFKKKTNRIPVILLTLQKLQPYDSLKFYLQNKTGKPFLDGKISMHYWKREIWSGAKSSHLLKYLRIIYMIISEEMLKMGQQK